MIKRLLSLFLAVVMVLSVLPTGFAVDDGTSAQRNDRREALPGGR